VLSSHASSEGQQQTTPNRAHISIQSAKKTVCCTIIYDLQFSSKPRAPRPKIFDMQISSKPPPPSPSIPPSTPPDLFFGESQSLNLSPMQGKCPPIQRQTFRILSSEASFEVLKLDSQGTFPDAQRKCRFLHRS
jgi:hypothetical protein